MVSSSGEGGIAGQDEARAPVSPANEQSRTYFDPPMESVFGGSWHVTARIGSASGRTLFTAHAESKYDAVANARVYAAAPALLTALTKIAYVPFGDAEASHAQVLHDITHYARSVLNGGEA